MVNPRMLQYKGTKILPKLITYRKPLNPTNFDTLNHVSNFSNPYGIGKMAVRLGQDFGHGQSVLSLSVSLSVSLSCFKQTQGYQTPPQATQRYSPRSPSPDPPPVDVVHPPADPTPSPAPDHRNFISVISSPTLPDTISAVKRGLGLMLSPSSVCLAKQNTSTAVDRAACAMRYSESTKARSAAAVAAAASPPTVDGNSTPPPSTASSLPQDDVIPASLHRAAKCFEHIKIGKPKLAPPDVETKITILRSGMQRVVENPNTWKWTKNHSRTQLESLRTSLSDPSSTLLPTDKTNKVCAMPRDLLASKLEDHFSEGWRPLPGDPSLVYQEEANSLMSECLTRAGLYSDYLCSRLSARYTWAPPVFPLAKDHKPQFPHCKVRVVQPVKGSAIEKLDIVVGRVLSQITRHLTYDVPSAQSFIETHLRPLSAQQSQIFQVSMDIESMYPSLPTGDRALTVIHQYLMDLADDIDTLGFSQSDIISMLKFILTHSYARAGDNYFLQIRGVGTGYHSSSPFAKILVDHTYKQALLSLPPSQQPRSLALYVDDSHSTWAEPDDHLPLLTSLNNIWPGELVFTVECSREGRLSFLDLMIDVSDSEGGRIEFEMFQKPTHSDPDLVASSGEGFCRGGHCPLNREHWPDPFSRENCGQSIGLTAETKNSGTIASGQIVESISRSYPLNCSSFCHICLEPRHDL
eukprot:sb/3462638/